jgi:short-subunit dehydrogenase
LGQFKNIIITGASNGLGMAMAKQYAGPGVHLGLIGRNRERLDITAKACRERGASVDAVSMDIRDRENLINWIFKFDANNPVDLVVANAGVMYSRKSEHPTEQKVVIDEIFDVNFNSVINTVNPLLEKMQQRKKGSAAIISSLSAYHGIPTFPAYSASKVAIKAYYEAIRGLYARDNIYITIVCPSYVDTAMTRTLKVRQFMLMPLDKAVDMIINGIDKRKALVSFPWYHALGISLLKLLPERLADRILLLVLDK